MSIIIRLQNLPWSANAENIRQFFGNLVIPDGGVHIVGGEHGDAFIAFGSDEDARQAMAKDGGEIKGVKVKLLLSSRVEMQKVIDTARQQALTSQNLLQTLSTVNSHLQYDPTAPAMPVNIPPNLLSALPGLVNLPGLNSLPVLPNVPTIPGMPSGMAPMPYPMPVTSSAARITDVKSVPTAPTIPRMTPVGEPVDKKKESAQQSLPRTQKTSRSRSRSRSSSRSRDRRGYRDKYRGRDSRSNERKYRRDRSKSRDRDKKSDRSRSRDRHRRRSRSRERRTDERSSRDHRNRSKERRRDAEKSGAKKEANSAEMASNATKVSNKPPVAPNNATNVPLAGSKSATNDVRVAALGENVAASVAATLNIMAKSSPSADAAKGGAEPKTTWPVGMIPPTAPAWVTAMPTSSERKSAAEPPKGAGGSASSPVVTSGASTLPQIPQIPGMPAMSAMGATMSSMASMSSMQSAMPYSMAAAYSMAYAAAPNNMYTMNRFPLTAQQAAVMYPGYPMGMMAQTNYGQFQPTAAATAAAMAKSAADEQPDKVDTYRGKMNEANNPVEEDEEEVVDCFGRVRKKSRRPSYSPEKVNSSYENGDRYDRRDSYKSRDSSYSNKPYHRDAYSNDDNSRFHRGGPDDGGYRKTSYRRNFDRHEGGGDDRRGGGGSGFERRENASGGDRRAYSRFDSGIDEERKAAAYEGRKDQGGGRHSKFDELPSNGRGTEYRRNYSRFEGREGSEDRAEKSFRQSRFDEPARRNAVATSDELSDEATAAPPPVVYQTCVEVRNVPADVTEQDMKRFFEPLPLYDSCIKFQYKTHEDGGRSTSVLVKFLNVAQRSQALQLSGKFIRGQRSFIVECDQQKFEQAEDMAVRLQQPYLKLMFVPKRATPDDIANAFILPPDEVVIVRQNGRESLEAYLKFADTQPAVDALKHKDKILICSSRVKLCAIPEKEFDAAKMTAKASGAPPANLETPSGNYVVESVVSEGQPADGSSANDEGGGGDGGGGRPMEVEGENNVDNGGGGAEVNGGAEIDLKNAPTLTCIRFDSLPPNVTDTDILNFLKDVDVKPIRIHIMFTAEGTPSGEAFCEFANEEAVHAALQKDRCLMKDFIVEMTPISMDGLMAAVNDIPEEYGPPSVDEPHLYPNYSGRGRPFVGRGGPRRPFGGRSPYAETRGGRRLPVLTTGPLAPEQFGRPGCVVALENVPYKASVEEIVEFFSDFRVNRSDVIRRYNEQNLATGDARVCLEDPSEALRAARSLDGQKIGDRYITVRLLR